jgi:hypothetical protein
MGAWDCLAAWGAEELRVLATESTEDTERREAVGWLEGVSVRFSFR